MSEKRNQQVPKRARAVKKHRLTTRNSAPQRNDTTQTSERCKVALNCWQERLLTAFQRTHTHNNNKQASKHTKILVHSTHMGSCILQHAHTLLGNFEKTLVWVPTKGVRVEAQQYAQKMKHIEMVVWLARNVYGRHQISFGAARRWKNARKPTDMQLKRQSKQHNHAHASQSTLFHTTGPLK